MDLRKHEGNTTFTYKSKLNKLLLYYFVVTAKMYRLELALLQPGKEQDVFIFNDDFKWNCNVLNGAKSSSTNLKDGWRSSPWDLFSLRNMCWRSTLRPLLELPLHCIVINTDVHICPRTTRKAFHTWQLSDTTWHQRICPTLTFCHSWCQWSSRPIRCWKLPLDLPGHRHKDKWCYQIKCLLMACRETKTWVFHKKPCVYLYSYLSK